MSDVTCPRCQYAVFEVSVTAHGVDFNVDVSGETAFPLDPTVIQVPDSVTVEAICRNCGHMRYVPDNEWVWA